MIHTLKGVSGNIGADTVHEQTKLVEASIHEEDSKKIEKGLNKLDNELKELFENIASKLDFGTKAENHELNKERVKNLYQNSNNYYLIKAQKQKQ